MNIEPITKHTDSDTAPTPTERMEALLAVCKASADHLRLKVLHMLSRDSYGVLELCSMFDCKQSGMSHHLKILSQAGLVTTRREGNTIFYRRVNRPTNDELGQLQQALFKTIDRIPTPPEIEERIAEVQKERAASSLAFFNENADKFSQQQEQIADYSIYGASTIELISKTFNQRNSNSLEIGPGEGAFLAELAPRFQRVYALDNSEQMLNKAAEFSKQSGLSNIELIQGDTKAKQLVDLNVECVVINMVLHHVPSPADIFSDVSSMLNKDGHLYVTDLCSHDQDWTRESCGDVWLGFDPEDLTQWAADAGFKTGENVYLAQRNGFRVQIRQFIKL